MVENHWIMVKKMIKNEKKKQSNMKMLIACYQRPYSKKAISKIETLLNENNPDELLVLSITEKRKSSGTIKSYLGRKDMKKLKDQYETDQEIRSTGYADKILEMSKNLNIPSRKIQEKGNISKIINDKIKDYNPDVVVINHSVKSKIDKLITGCVEDTITKKCSNIVVV